MKTKRQIAIILVAMLIASTSVTAFAAEKQDADPMKASESVINNEMMLQNAGEQSFLLQEVGENKTSVNEKKAQKVLMASSSGTIQDSISWSCDENGTLTISGTGELNRSGSWDSSSIKDIIISEGITAIKGAPFDYCYNVESVSFPESLNYLGAQSFNQVGVKSINYAGTKSDWDHIVQKEPGWSQGNGIYYHFMKEDSFESQYVTNFSATGKTYNSVQFNWDSNPQADGYYIYYGDPFSDKTVITINDKDASSYTIKTREEWMYSITPYKIVDGKIVEGKSLYSVEGKPLDLNKEEYTNDNTTPIINNIVPLSKVIFKPTSFPINLDANGTGSGIERVKLCMSRVVVEGLSPSIHKEDIPLVNEHIGGSESFNDTVNLVFPGEEGVSVGYGPVNILSVYVYDKAGNCAMFSNFSETDTITCEEEFQIEFEGTLSNPNVIDALTDMEEGMTVKLSIDSKSKGILKKELLDAIKGKDKTIIVYADDKESLQWVFYGKDISGTTKELDLNVSMGVIRGSIYGGAGNLLKLVFADNGILPGVVHFRVRSGYLSGIYSLSGKIYLYNLSSTNLVSLEQSDCKVLKDGGTYWTYVDLKHNSKYLMSGKKLSNTIAGKAVSLSKSSYIYNGKARRPAVRVKNESVSLVKGKDFNVSYANNKKVGMATVTISGKGNYKGTVKKTFKITPKGTTLSRVTPSKKSMTIKWKKQAVQSTGYQIQYSLKKNFKKAKTKTIKKNTVTSKKIKKLKKKKKYYVRVRTYKKVKGKKYYSSWSKAKTVKTK